MTPKELIPATKLPALPTDEALAEFFDTHDTSRLWQQMKPAPPVRLPARQRAAIRARHDARPPLVPRPRLD